MPNTSRLEAVDYAKEVLQKLYLDKGITSKLKQAITGHIKANIAIFPPHHFGKDFPPEIPFISFLLDGLIEKAQTNKAAFNALKVLCAAWLEHKEDIPDPRILEYASAILTGKLIEPKQRGKEKDYQLTEALWMTSVLLHKKFDIQYDKNAASTHNNNIFSIVADAAVSLGVSSVTENTVRKAYKQYSSPQS